MATVTPIYNWPVPTSTDYVKDGATAIESLGDAIDSSLNSITAGKNVGLVHINTTAITSGTTNVQISNVFTTNFDHYRIVGNFTSASAPYLVIKLRDAGGDLTNNYSTNVSSQAADNLHNNAVTSNWQGGYYNTNIMNFAFDVFNPFRSVASFASGITYYDNSTDIWGGRYSPSTSCTGISIMPSTGTFTGGNIRIYGYRNS